MKYWFVTILAVAVVLIACISRCSAAECLSSASQVRAAHGVTAWATWRNVDGRKCWMIGERKVMTHKTAGLSIPASHTDETRPRSANLPTGAAHIEVAAISFSSRVMTVWVDEWGDLFSQREHTGELNGTRFRVSR